MMTDIVIVTTFNKTNIDKLKHYIVADYENVEHITLLGNICINGAIVGIGLTFEDAVTKAKILTSTL